MVKWSSSDGRAPRNDEKKVIKKGVIVMQKGARVAGNKAGELTEEGKRRYMILELKAKAQKRLYDLGNRVYRVLGASSRPRNPTADAKVREIVAQIKGLEIQIAALEQTLAGRTGRTGKRQRGA
jgi:hypothetical protein